MVALPGRDVPALADPADEPGLVDEWRALAEAAGNAFTTPEWYGAYARYYGADAPPFVVRVRDADVLVLVTEWDAFRALDLRRIAPTMRNPVLVDRQSRLPVATMAVRAADGRDLSLSELEWLDRAELPAESAGRA